jgi:hypothetical protein
VTTRSIQHKEEPEHAGRGFDRSEEEIDPEHDRNIDESFVPASGRLLHDRWCRLFRAEDEHRENIRSKVNDDPDFLEKIIDIFR